MKPKVKIKCVIDILMTIALLFLMGYQFWGERAHGWIGAGMFVLFIFHHILNRKWYQTLFRGKYTPVRIFQRCVDLLAFAAMIALMYSGIVLSRHAVSFLQVFGGMSFARRLHILGSYWGFLLMSIHLGLHWNMIINMVKNEMQLKKSSKARSVLLFFLGAAISLYGIGVFIKRDFLTYLLLRSEFVFLDYGESVLLFYIDYFALMGLCIFIGHYLSKLLRWVHGRNTLRAYHDVQKEGREKGKEVSK